MAMVIKGMSYIRRVQKTGGSTYIVSLPKEWVKRIGITNGSIVYLDEQPDGSLRVSARRGQPIRVERVIRVSSGHATSNVIREVISSYLAGFTSVRVELENASSINRSKLKEIVESSIIGFNVIEETPDYIVFYNVAYPSELPLFKALGNAFRVAYSMLRDCLKGIGEESPSLLDSVIERDDLVDRLYLLIAKQLNDMLSGKLKPEDLNLQSMPEALHVFLGAKSIERVADHATLIASYSKSMLSRGLRVPSILLNALSDATNIFENAARSLVYLNKDRAMKTAVMVEDFWDSQASIIDKLKHDPNVEAYLVFDSIKRITGYSLDIAEAVIDIMSARSYIGKLRENR